MSGTVYIIFRVVKAQFWQKLVIVHLKFFGRQSLHVRSPVSWKPQAVSWAMTLSTSIWQSSLLPKRMTTKFIIMILELAPQLSTYITLMFAVVWAFLAKVCFLGVLKGFIQDKLSEGFWKNVNCFQVFFSRLHLVWKIGLSSLSA